MKIILISQLPPPSGGIATWSKAYLDYLNKSKDVEVSCVNCALKGKRADNFNAKRNIFTEIKRTISIFKETSEKVRYDIDVVHLNSSCSALGILRDWLCIRAIKKDIPIVLHCHCTIQDQLKENTISKYFFRKTAKRASKIIVLNEISRKWVQNQIGCNAVVLPNFINEELVIEQKKKRTTEIREVFFAGHLLESKGIKEMAAIAEKNLDVHFTFAGAYTEEVKKLLDKSNITLLGDVNHQSVIDYLDNADLYLFLSHTEGFSISLLEAMARGIPCMVSEVGANADMVEDCGGIVVEAQNEKEALEGFEKAKKMSVEEYETISKLEINKVMNCYTTSIVLNGLLSIYRGI